jgi:hypothetical protein
VRHDDENLVLNKGQEFNNKIKTFSKNPSHPKPFPKKILFSIQLIIYNTLLQSSPSLISRHHFKNPSLFKQSSSVKLFSSLTELKSSIRRLLKNQNGNFSSGILRLLLSSHFLIDFYLYSSKNSLSTGLGFFCFAGCLHTSLGTLGRSLR